MTRARAFRLTAPPDLVRKRLVGSASFSVPDALRRAAETLARPPAFDWIERPVPRGFRVASFVLPLAMLEPQNRRSHAPDWVMAQKRAQIWRLLVLQRGELRREPLPGRPQVICVRFSSVAPDAYSDGFKAAIDALCVPKGRRKHGLGLLTDDSPKHADIKQRWEPAKRGEGFGYIEVWTG